VVAIVAQRGYKEEAALDAGLAILGKWVVNAKMDSNQKISIDTLDTSLDILQQVDGKSRRTLLLAICEVAAHDGDLNVAEGELIRVVCASLDCPLPPILVANS
jgi:hypothetical protein